MNLFIYDFIQKQSWREQLSNLESRAKPLKKKPLYFQLAEKYLAVAMCCPQRNFLFTPLQVLFPQVELIMTLCSQATYGHMDKYLIVSQQRSLSKETVTAISMSLHGRERWLIIIVYVSEHLFMFFFKKNLQISLSKDKYLLSNLNLTCGMKVFIRVYISKLLQLITILRIFEC